MSCNSKIAETLPVSVLCRKKLHQQRLTECATSHNRRTFCFNSQICLRTGTELCRGSSECIFGYLILRLVMFIISNAENATSAWEASNQHYPTFCGLILSNVTRHVKYVLYLNFYLFSDKLFVCLPLFQSILISHMRSTLFTLGTSLVLLGVLSLKRAILP
jgi:hypothetical protein